MRGGGTGGDGSTNRDEESARPSPDLDGFHQLLCSAPRRRVLYYLQEHPETSLEELCDAVAGWKALEEDDLVGPRERDRIRVSLHHTDVPRLVETGVVEYDREDHEVRLGPLPDRLSRILSESREYERERRTGESDGARSEP